MKAAFDAVWPGADAGCRMMSKFARQNGPFRPYLAACSGSSTWVNSLIRLFFTAKTASDSMYGLPATKMCVVSAR